MRKIKILYIVNTFNVGGLETLVINCCNLLNKQKFEVHILVLDQNSISSLKYLNSSIHIHTLDYTNQNKKNLFKLLIILKKLKLKIDYINPDIIHNHTAAATLLFTVIAIKLSESANCSHFKTVHTTGLFYESQNCIANKIKLFAEKLSLRLFNNSYIISVSRSVHKNNIFYFKRLVKDIKLIYNGVDLNIFDEVKNEYVSKLDFSFSEDDIIISYVARLDYGKNHDFLINLFVDIIKIIPKSKLCFAGDGILKEYLVQKTKEKNIEENIIFLGSISNVSELLAISDFAVFPSSFEGFGLVMLEKFAMSLPVVASDIDAFKEIGENGKNCFLVSLEDKELYKKRIIELCKDEQLRKQIGANARLRAMEFDINKCITSHEEYYLKGLK